jgi:uncharacterized protein involved in exopolysaccharide biosynthesis
VSKLNPPLNPTPLQVLEERLELEQRVHAYYLNLLNNGGEIQSDLRTRIANLQAELNTLSEKIKLAPMRLTQIDQKISSLRVNIANERVSAKVQHKASTERAWTRPAWMTPEIEKGMRAAGVDPKKVAEQAKGA